MKTGEEGEDSGEERVEMVDGETGESCSEPEREEEEPETNRRGEHSRSRGVNQRAEKSPGTGAQLPRIPHTWGQQEKVDGKTEGKKINENRKRSDFNQY